MKSGILSAAVLLCGVAIAAPASAQGVKIGILNDQSGVYADYGGKYSLEAAHMAVEDFGGSVLGAKVGPKAGEPHEFGYYEITPTEAGRAWFPDRLVVCEAHFHEFQIPAGGERLAGSALFANQAFRYGASTFGFQFHAEVTPAGFRRWQNSAWAGFGKPGVQPRAEQDAAMKRHDSLQHAWFMQFLDRLFGEAVKSA